jgi:hypothetical protein
MADTTVAKRSALELYDAISECLVKAQGICALASLVPGSSEEIPDDALVNAMWAARDLMTEVGDLASQLQAQAEARNAAPVEGRPL